MAELHSNCIYMFQHLGIAITTLVTGIGTIEERVEQAGNHYSAMAIKSLPEELHELSTKIKNNLTEFRNGHSLDTKMAENIAKDMWSLYHQYEGYLE